MVSFGYLHDVRQLIRLLKLSGSWGRVEDYDSDTDTLVGTSDDLDLDDRGCGPPEAMLKYPPHSEVFYPENEDGVDSEGTELVEELRPL